MSILNSSVIPALLTASSLLSGCGGDTQLPTPPAIENIATLTVAAAEAGSGRAWDGVIEATRQATLSAQTNGRVLEVLKDINDAAAEGELLIRLSAVEQAAGADAARAQLRAADAAASEAESTYNRFLNLAAGQYVSQLQLEQMRTARDAALAVRDAARAQLANAGQQNDYTSIRAPYAGIIATREVEPGESVGLGQRLLTLFAPETLRIEVSVPQTDAEQIRARPQAQISFSDGRRIDGAQVIVFPSADALTHSIKVRIALPLLDPPPVPGSTVKVNFPALPGSTLPRIPVSTLVQRGELNAVYVLAQGRLSLRQLRLGERGDDMVEVIAGLRNGETIALDPNAAAQALAMSRRE
jgi:RND family efflux transporter MFP subunit